jgi:hypothetical protein
MKPAQPQLPPGKLGVLEFGRQLVESKDLDPLYILLWEAKLPRPQLCKWLTIYFCTYHVGVACQGSEENEWDFLDKVANGGTTYPRGSERRHWRGNTAITSARYLRNHFADAESLINWLGQAGPRAPAIMKRVKTLYGFGDWISGKVPDICERLQLFPVTFVDRDVDLMFDSPKKGAMKVAEMYCQPTTDPLMTAHQFIIQNLGTLLAPPRYERMLNVQETETIFCKAKSHWSGHYPIGKDSIEIKHALKKYLGCVTAQKLLEAGMATNLWKV